MSNTKIIAEREDLVAIADATRNATGTTEQMSLYGIANAINEISGGINMEIVQQTGTSTTAVMSQAAVTNELNDVSEDAGMLLNTLVLNGEEKTLTVGVDIQVGQVIDFYYLVEDGYTIKRTEPLFGTSIQTQVNGALGAGKQYSKDSITVGDVISYTFIGVYADISVNLLEEVMQLSENIGIQKVKLYENASPASTFGAQDLFNSMQNYGEYDMFLAIFKVSETGDKYISSITVKGCIGRVQAIGNLTESGNPYYVTRDWYPNGNGSQFYIYDATYKQGTSASSNGNNYLIPYRIYGIKGVQ